MTVEECDESCVIKLSLMQCVLSGAIISLGAFMSIINRPRHYNSVMGFEPGSGVLALAAKLLTTYLA